MGYIPIESLQYLDTNMIPVVYELDHLKALAEHRPNRKVHVKVETGLNRQGVTLSDLANFVEKDKRPRSQYYGSLHTLC